MASRITSGARLCVRASIDKLVCNLARSRHHNAATGGGTAVAPGLDRTIPSYQVSEPSDREYHVTTRFGNLPSRKFWGFLPGRTGSRRMSFFIHFALAPAQGPFNDFSSGKKLRRDFFFCLLLFIRLGNGPRGLGRSAPVPILFYSIS